MADRYWVGGAGTWDGTNTTNWSTSSGGSGGASVPTSADNVFLDANSGGGSVSCSFPSAVCASLNVTGFTGSLTGTLYTNGDITFGTTGSFSSLQLRVQSAGTLAAGTLAKISVLRVQISSGGTLTITGTLEVGLGVDIDNGKILASTATVKASSITNNDIYSNTFNVVTSTLDSSSAFANIYNYSSGGIAIVSLKYPNNLWSSGSGGSIFIQSFGALANRLSVRVSSTGSLQIPAWPTSAQISNLTIDKSGSGTLTPSVPSSISGYSSLTLTGSYVIVSFANSPNLDIALGAQVTTAQTNNTVRVRNNAYVGTLNMYGTNLKLLSNTPTTTVIGTVNVQSNLTVTDGSTGTIDTLNFGTGPLYSSGARTLTAEAGATLRVNNLNIGDGTSAHIVTSSDHPTTQAKIEAVSSFSLQGIEWRSIDADGIVPFTGTGFFDGGNNLDIELPAGNGLFFGSNF
jgi:hypothetical protein